MSDNGDIRWGTQTDRRTTPEGEVECLLLLTIIKVTVVQKQILFNFKEELPVRHITSYLQEPNPANNFLFGGTLPAINIFGSVF